MSTENDPFDAGEDKGPTPEQVFRSVLANKIWSCAPIFSARTDDYVILFCTTHKVVWGIKAVSEEALVAGRFQSAMLIGTEANAKACAIADWDVCFAGNLLDRTPNTLSPHQLVDMMCTIKEGREVGWMRSHIPEGSTEAELMRDPDFGKPYRVTWTKEEMEGATALVQEVKKKQEAIDIKRQEIEELERSFGLPEKGSGSGLPKPKGKPRRHPELDPEESDHDGDSDEQPV